jgi:alkanesulfonate monooxygenase SsuD/methylene tetrahydromethanopterin reductase-like flavin-dependent oxidoreductase (luciferase family)
MVEARTDAEASLLHYYRAQARLLADSAGRAGVDQVVRRNDTAERLATITCDEALRGSVFIGTPDSVAAQLHALQDELGLDGILLELNCGGKIPHQRVMTATQLLCQEVMPRFH